MKNPRDEIKARIAELWKEISHTLSGTENADAKIEEIKNLYRHGDKPMTKKYGPIIAHQGGYKCPCDPDAEGRRWYKNGAVCHGQHHRDCDWTQVIAYQLEIKPKRKTVDEIWHLYIDECTKSFIFQASPVVSNVPAVRFTVNYEDGEPVSGSWGVV